jgi:hypothetical protein
MVQFALPRGRPTDQELDAIIEDVSRLEARQRRVPTKDEWHAITLEHVQFSESPFHKGLNFQDLNAVLAQIRASAARGR